MIRQAISCDICGTEKRQTNHWFVAYEQAGELRLGAWGSRNRQRHATKHLCGQTCLHKLVDEFMARCVADRAPAVPAMEADEAVPAIDTGLTSNTANDEFESSARLLTPPDPPLSAHGYKPQSELVAMPARRTSEVPEFLPAESPRYASRSRHAEAWQRERAREMHADDHPPELARRRSRA